MKKPERFKGGDIATLKRVNEFMDYADWAEKSIDLHRCMFMDLMNTVDHYRGLFKDLEVNKTKGD